MAECAHMGGTLLKAARSLRKFGCRSICAGSFAFTLSPIRMTEQ